MRSFSDRIRQSVLFEVIALAIVTPAGAWVYGTSLIDFGIAGAATATIAMVWNYVFNLAFDRAMLRFTGSTGKRLRTRIAHALLFEAGLCCLLVPFVAWYLALSLLDALIIDLSLVGFYLVYAFAFNWLYDIVFPIPGASSSVTN